MSHSDSHTLTDAARVRIGWMLPAATRFLPALVLGVTTLAAAAIACGSVTLPTSTPLPPTATAGPTVAANADPGVADYATPSGVEDVARAVPSVPHRVYNVIGADDAPIVLYDYSDFV